ncbi:hypothetical protein CTAYLR_009986 [Chrysophaeum taylorii]|uniref:SLC41A/MgtE integral membrane domain-containing protein n=1 Tax=Chrysophaeum taylorii TaxID=2483200 RepID=A0AAD7UI86_9STRA|nr:hypothetical protein CTAYLR_009986 [Chrysophaeum taylorii]
MEAMEVQTVVQVTPLGSRSAELDEPEDLEKRAFELRQQLEAVEEQLGKREAGSFEEYFATSYTRLLRDRLPWLVGLLLLQSSAALIMGTFENLLDKHLVIAFFVPMIVGTGGNAGNQPGVMTTRALSRGTFDSHKLHKLVRRETLLALVTGTLLAVLAFLRVLLQYPSKIKEAGAISIAVFLMVNLAIFIGVAFSIVIDRTGADPANGAAPLLTTVADLVGITLLCAVAALLLSA